MSPQSTNFIMEVIIFGADINDTKEDERLHIRKQLKEKQINLKKAANILSLSKRQVIRIKKSYFKFGIHGLISKRRGKPSPNKIADDIKLKIARNIEEKYHDFGPTLAKEKLEKNEQIKNTCRKYSSNHDFSLFTFYTSKISLKIIVFSDNV